MSELFAPPPAGPTRWPRLLPVLVLLFAGSGCAALIYEIVWFQMLQLIIGSSAVSLAVLLGTFMGGMCAGSVALPRVVSAERHPLRVFALLEAGVGLSALGVLLLAPALGRFYLAAAGPGMPGILLRGLVAAVCLLPPTLLMGAALPAISRWAETTPGGLSWLGFLYGGNLAGAVLGSLLAGFYLLRVHDLPIATCVAASLNGAVAGLALVLAAWAPRPAAPARGCRSVPAPAQGDTAPESGPLARHHMAGLWAVSVAIGLSGLCALSAEVLWTRLLSLMLGATVYTFSIILAVFLGGLGIGSHLGARLGRASLNPRIALGYCQLLLAGSIVLASWLLARSLPYWPINPSLSRSPWFTLQLDLLRCAWAILPATCLWGASFPLALAAAATTGGDPGRLVGKIYAANTVGAIIGAVATTLLLIPWLGTRQTERLLAGLSATAGLLMLLSSKSSRAPRFALLLATAALCALLAWTVPSVPWELIAFGRYLPSRTDLGTLLYLGEGMNCSVAVSQSSDGQRIFHVSGKAEASTGPRDMRLQRMLGHLPALLHPRPRSVLVVGCGAGVTAGSFTQYPEVETIALCEIEPLIPKVVARYFAAENYNVVQDQRVRNIFDDARHYLLTTRDKFDVITSDPIHPWVKGAATLYTKEYFESCRRHLNPGGLVSQWVPLYESNLETVKSELATFFEVFTNGTIWSNDEAGAGYDLVLLGQVEALKIEVGQVQKRLNREDYRRVADSLRNAGFKSAFSLLATYAGQASDLKPWLGHAQINQDRDLRLQYLAGWGLNLYQQEPIYSELARYRRFPQEIFVGSDEWSQALRWVIEPQGGK